MTADLRSYGRRRGRIASPRGRALLDSVLPRLAVDLSHPPPVPLVNLFRSHATPEDVWLEIGFGGGEHLAALAQANPGIGFIGCEPFEDGVVKLVRAVGERGFANVRIFPDDARLLLRWLPEASLGRVYMLFPDPWPKRRHAKRRLFSAATLDGLARVMRPAALLRVATDSDDYTQTMLLAAAAHPAFESEGRSAANWRERPADEPPTRYEMKALAAGRRCRYLAFRRLSWRPRAAP